MRRSLMAALMAATALLPGVATAQRDDGNWRGGARQSEDRAGPAAQPQQQRGERENREPRADRGGGNWNNAGRPDRAEVPAQIAQADRRPDRGDRGNWRGNDRGGTPAALPDRGGVDGRGQAQRDRGQWQGNDRGRGNDWRGNDDRGGQWRGNDNRGNQWRGNDNRGNQWRGNDGRNDARNGGNWNRNWRQDNRYDWNRRRQVNRNAFHLPRYYAPYGWNSGYRRFGIGFQLSSVLFQQNYWIDDAYGYGLPEAYGPYRWVRYYNDALLVDVYSGDVVDTVYDIFW